MRYRDVETLGFAYSSLRDFILNNGIYKIPEWWAFLLETSCMLSWFVLFLVAIALLVGYSRQMSSFFFFYQHIMGEKLDNPYKPALLLLLFWCGLYVISGTVTLAGVYLFKYGYFYAILAVLGGLGLLAALFYAGMSLRSGNNRPEQTYRPPPPQQPQYTDMQPAYAALPPQNVQALPPQAPQMIAGPGGEQIQQQGAPNQDPRFEEAILILDLKRDFTKDQLEKKYKAMLKSVHPDKGGSEGLYLKVKGCYEYLLRFC
ncbi:MAG: hypothetical protein ACRBDL_09910 [Alphaproteobacteria bacterium]